MTFSTNILLLYAFRFCTAALVLFAIIAILQLIQISKTPSDIPWVGLGNRKVFPKLRACLSELFVGRSMIDEGYEKYGRHGKPFILPSMLWIAVILPPSNASWVAQQSDSIISGTTTVDDVMALHYITHGPSAESCRDFTVIRRDLTRQIMKLSNEVYDEIKAGFDEELKEVGDEWTGIKLQRVFLDVSFRAGNRIFVGLPMCRDKKYKKAVERWTAAFGLSNMVSRFMLPTELRGIFLRLAAIPTKFFEWRAARFFMERIKERLARLQNGEKCDENDMMQWIIDQNASKRDPRELEPQNIAGKMILFNIFATGTTAVGAGTTLHNLLSSPQAASLLPQIQTEASKVMLRVLDDPRQIREMAMLDSLIRETLRYQPITPQGLIRQVVKPGGVTTPDGVFLPEGTHIHSLVKHMHHDTDIFGEGADSFDPFRFYHPPASSSSSQSSLNQERKQKIAVQVSADYLPWGLGKHACPGRFFAVHVMKLILGHLFSEYDLQPLEKMPKIVEIADMEFPSEEVVVKMRKRKARNSENIHHC